MRRGFDGRGIAIVASDAVIGTAASDDFSYSRELSSDERLIGKNAKSLAEIIREKQAIGISTISENRDISYSTRDLANYETNERAIDFDDDIGSAPNAVSHISLYNFQRNYANQCNQRITDDADSDTCHKSSSDTSLSAWTRLGDPPVPIGGGGPGSPIRPTSYSMKKGRSMKCRYQFCLKYRAAL